MKKMLYSLSFVAYLWYHEYNIINLLLLLDNSYIMKTMLYSLPVVQILDHENNAINLLILLYNYYITKRCHRHFFYGMIDKSLKILSLVLVSFLSVTFWEHTLDHPLLWCSPCRLQQKYQTAVTCWLLDIHESWNKGHISYQHRHKDMQDTDKTNRLIQNASKMESKVNV